MYKILGESPLKNGESLEIGVVRGPDDAHAEELCPFLIHKGPLWNDHIRLSLTERLDDLETYYYVGKLDGRIITNIMTVEHLGVGILGHVFTTPDHRRKGACDAVMKLQMDDFRRRGGRCLYLGTGFDSAPYHIYKRNGFESVYPRVGLMSYFATPDFDEMWFAPTPLTIRELRWRDWGPLTALTARLHGDWLRSLQPRSLGPTSYEWTFLAFKTPAPDFKDRTSRVMVTETGAVVAFANLRLDGLWRNAQLLDVICHQNFWNGADGLLTDILPANGRVQSYADEASEGKIALLERCGFKETGRLKSQILRNLRPDWQPDTSKDVMFDDSAFEARWLDVLLFTRDA